MISGGYTKHYYCSGLQRTGQRTCTYIYDSLRAPPSCSRKLLYLRQGLIVSVLAPRSKSRHCMKTVCPGWRLVTDEAIIGAQGIQYRTWTTRSGRSTTPFPTRGFRSFEGSHTHIRFEARSRLAHPRSLQAGVVLNSIAGFLGCLHLVFATATFSALFSIAPLDAIGQIAMRLMLSALVCRLVVVFEIAGLRGQAPDAKEVLWIMSRV